MRMVSGSICRVMSGSNNLNVRATPVGAIVATLVTGALVELLGKPVDGWVRVIARGWTDDGKTIYFEPDVRSGKKAAVRSAGWRFVEVQGAVAVQFLELVDGPQ
jgi:hypothetical protein